ncbi:hypothetical protein [Inhella sp.]|uniref:hypothetical protein n=1 Tax=Inhella sp. TaxID=1921806 RepID=UPI0035B01A49
MSRGGSRWGAGRPAYKGKAEHCLSLDVRRLHRGGHLKPGAACSWGWQREGKRVGEVGLEMIGNALHLRFAVNGRNASHSIGLTFTACPFGGERPWFACPGCCRRVAVVYLRGAGPFRCRQCNQLAYASQSMDAMDRAWKKQQRIERKLNPKGGKPKGMHWATFERLRDLIADCDMQREAALALAFDKLLML